ncbi:hypothetical protein [Diaminobutyricimonas sp. LJ205]|uniref:hypothetical protein n=1 Tax=Diaminobutyricimonas sp. LJ205 TaxID=2683590 RepID=UPI0012F47C17|nr:hypothetical protein [Diaminobutyricimonas sp. LJ205]
MRALYLAGSAMVLALIAMLTSTVLLLASGGPAASLPEGWTRNHVIGVGFILIVLAAACFILAEFSRRGRIEQDRDGGMFGFGSNRSETGRVSTGFRVLWILVGLAGWCALTLLPLVLVGNYYAGDDLWFILAAYGFFAAGSVGVMLTSLVKAAFHDRAVAAGRFVHVSEATGRKASAQLPSGQKFWRFASYQFRLELLVGFAAGATLGLIPFALAETGADCGSIFAECLLGIPTLALGTLVTGVILAALAVALASQTWRSGEHLTAAESMASGPRAFQKSGG